MGGGSVGSPRCRRILFIGSGSVMKEIIFIGSPHLRQSNGRVS